jgi:hypothetical protein
MTIYRTQKALLANRAYSFYRERKDLLDVLAVALESLFL